MRATARLKERRKRGKTQVINVPQALDPTDLVVAGATHDSHTAKPSALVYFPTCPCEYVSETTNMKTDICFDKHLAQY